MLTRGQIKRHLLPGLNVGGLRRWIAYQPLALLLAILMLPSLSWMVGGNPFQARAQVSSCTSTSNSIIQNYCTTPVGNQLGGNFQTDLVQLESDAVNAYLAAHNLPATDAHVVYDYGRADLRNAIRGNIISILLGIIATPASSRTAHQAALFQWLQSLVWVNEIADYTDSYNEFLTWQIDPCGYTLDPQVASQYSISYNGAAFCGVSESSVFNTVVPAPSYFKAVGLERSYQAWSSTVTCPVKANGTQDKSCTVILQDSTVNMTEVAGIAAAAGTIVDGAVGGALGASFFAANSAWIEGLATLTDAGANTATAGASQLSALFVLSGTTVDSALSVTASLGSALALVVMDIAVGVTAGVDAFDAQQSLNQLNDLKNQITAVTNTPPDLNGMATDTSGLGLLKIENTVMPQTLKTNADGTQVDIPSIAPLPAHRPGTDLEFENVSNSTTYSPLPYKGWNGESWAAQTWGGWMVQTCANGTSIDKQTDGTCIQADSISADLHYIDSRFEGTLNRSPGLQVFELSRFSAARFGTTFFATRSQGQIITQLAPPGNTLNTCPVYPQNQFSLDADGLCWSYVDFQLPIVAADGTSQAIMLTNLLSPTFTSPTVMAFGPGIPSTPTITVAGDPMPDVCIVSSNLPGNFKITGSPSYAWFGTTDCSNMSGAAQGFGTVGVQLTFDGLLTAPVGNYSLTLKAVNNLGGSNIHAVSQTFTINVSPELSIISPATMIVTSGVPANFTVVATGVPSPSLTVDGVDLGGMTFTDNGNGTATIAGIDSNTINITSCFVSGTQACAIVATNSQGVYRQPFLVNLTPAPTARLACNPCSATFTAGAANLALLTSSGATTPVSWLFGNDLNADPPPYPWLSLHDNGDGTAVLSGTPPYAAVGTYNIALHPAAQYSNTRDSQYTINVVNNAVFTSPNTATFTVGTSSAFGIFANAGTISSGNALPNGLSVFQGSTLACLQCLASISGSPAAGTGGQYAITLNDDAGTAGTAAQLLTLNVNEAPTFTSAAVATMFSGLAGSVAVTTIGYPIVSNHVIPANPVAPTDPSAGQGMFFTVTGLPQDLQVGNLSPAGFATGTLTIQGTPSAADVGTHQVQVVAQNGVGGNVTQNLSLHIIPYSPTVLVSLLSIWALSRDASNNVIASVVIANNGAQTAQNVSITSAAIGSVAGVFPPSAAASIPAGSSATFRIQFAAASLGASGSPSVLTLSGTYTGGSFSNAGRIVLP